MFFNRRVPLFIREYYYYDSKAALLWGVFWGGSVAFFPVIARRIGASSFQMALLTSGPFLGSLFTIYWSRISNNVDKMKFFLSMKILARAIIFLMVLAVNPWLFIVVVFLNALFEQAGSPAYLGIMKEIYPGYVRGKTMGYVLGEQAISAICASYMAGILLDWITYRYVFPLAAVIGICSLAYFGKIKTKSKNKTRNVKKHGVIPFEAIDVFRKDKSFFYYSLIFFAYGFGSLLAMPLYPIFLVDILRVSNSTMGKLVSISSFLWLISYIFWGRYIDRKGEVKSLIVLILISSFVPLLYSVSFSLPLIILAGAISGFTIGSELVRVTYIAKITKPENVQTYLGIDFSLMGIRGIVAPFLGVGLMNLVGIRRTLFISFVIILGAFCFMKWFDSHFTQEQAETLMAGSEGGLEGGLRIEVKNKMQKASCATQAKSKRANLR